LTQITPLFCHTLRTFPDSPAWDLPDDLPDTRLATWDPIAVDPPGENHGEIMAGCWENPRGFAIGMFDDV